MTAIESRSLHLAYIMTWVIQLAYLVYVLYCLRRSRKHKNQIE